jgi:predicted transcriptional regulator
MSSKRSSLGQLELEVLKVIWQHQPCTVSQVADFLGKRDGYARTTILTVMQRLHQKAFLKRKKISGAFKYSTTEARNTVMSRLIGQFVEKVLDGSALPFVAYLTETDELTNDQIAALRDIAKELENKQQERQ